MTYQAAVIGTPISHSLSPEIFGFLATQAFGVQMNYRAVEVAPQDLRGRLFEFSQERGFLGLNVTVPHKEAVMKLVKQLSPLAQVVGAANVLHLQDGQWTAHNTDVFGISESLRETGFQFYRSDILILGAGGAARAAAAALAQERANSVDIFNRTYERGQDLAHDMSAHFPQTDFFSVTEKHELKNKTYDLVIQSTTLGMQGIEHDAKMEFTPIFEFIKGTPLAFDLIYRPEDTAFLQLAQAAYMPTLGGIHLLAHQALATWKIWLPDFHLPKDIAPRLIDHLREFLKRGGVRT